MGLKFGQDKCVQMHIGKSHNPDTCTPCEVDAWDEVVRNQDGNIHVEDKYLGVEALKTVHEKMYLGDIISSDMKKINNIKEKTNKAIGKSI